ncbi:MAG: nuclear transport factor 2 family protein, partial [Beijerinckiaceae bacterium]
MSRPDTSDDLAALRRAVQTYLDGVHEGDADKLAAVFLPSSALTQSFGGELKITPRDVWLEAVRGRPSPQSQGLERDDHVLTIDL